MAALSAQQSGAQGASAEAKGLRAELEHVRRAADIAAVELAGARSELEASRSSLAAREDRIRTLEANAGRAEGAQAASAATAEAVAAGESRIAELSARVSDLGGQLAKAQEESRVQRSMVRRLEEQMETHMEQAAAAVRSVEGQQAADAQAALQRIARLDSLIAESRAHVARLEADVAAEKAEKEKAVAEERAQAAKRVDEATAKAKEKQESIKASAQKQFAELKDRFMQDLEVANKQHADAMAVQAERIAEMSRAQAHLGANMADARRKAQDVHAAGDSLRKALKAQLADFGGVLAGTSSQVSKGRGRTDGCVKVALYCVAAAYRLPLLRALRACRSSSRASHPSAAPLARCASGTRRRWLSGGDCTTSCKSCAATSACTAARGLRCPSKRRRWPRPSLRRARSS